MIDGELTAERLAFASAYHASVASSTQTVA